MCELFCSSDLLRNIRMRCFPYPFMEIILCELCKSLKMYFFLCKYNWQKMQLCTPVSLAYSFWHQAGQTPIVNNFKISLMGWISFFSTNKRLLKFSNALWHNPSGTKKAFERKLKYLSGRFGQRMFSIDGFIRGWSFGDGGCFTQLQAWLSKDVWGVISYHSKKHFCHH